MAKVVSSIRVSGTWPKIGIAPKYRRCISALLNGRSEWQARMFVRVLRLKGKIFVTRRTFGELIATGSIVESIQAAERLRLGIGTYTYHNVSVDEMILQLKRLDIAEIE